MDTEPTVTFIPFTVTISFMLELKSLNIQLENLKIIYADAMLKGQTFNKIKLYYLQIVEMEELIAIREAFLEKRELAK